MIFALLTGCGADLRTYDEVQNGPLDTLIKSDNKENVEAMKLVKEEEARLHQTPS